METEFIPNSTGKTCETCLYCASKEKCKDCLGTPQEIRDNNEQFLYRNYKEGDFMKRLDELQQSGERNIVIGGMGEAEVNVNDSPEETYKNLCYVSEQCGYLTTKGIWSGTIKEIHIYSDNGHYVITYYINKFERIDKLITVFKV